jgi:hypothetical protein
VRIIIRSITDLLCPTNTAFHALKHVTLRCCRLVNPSAHLDRGAAHFAARVYKADRSLLSVCTFDLIHILSTELMLSIQRLKEIGTNPSSPKALGDLLMRWVRPSVEWCFEFHILILFDRSTN